MTILRTQLSQKQAGRLEHNSHPMQGFRQAVVHRDSERYASILIVPIRGLDPRCGRNKRGQRDVADRFHSNRPQCLGSLEQGSSYGEGRDLHLMEVTLILLEM